MHIDASCHAGAVPQPEYSIGMVNSRDRLCARASGCLRGLCRGLPGYVGGVRQLSSLRCTLDCPEVPRHLPSQAAGVTPGDAIPTDEVLTTPCDILVPAAIGGVLDEAVARKVTVVP